jgi:hypothetical protein
MPISSGLSSVCRHLLAGFLLGSLFDPEDGGSIFLPNIVLSPNHTFLQYRKPFVATTVRSSNPTILISLTGKCVVVMAARKRVKEFGTSGIEPKNIYIRMLLHRN